jgi:hypothetical protein
MERQTYDSLAFSYISCNLHPDHCTISAFRSRFTEEISELFDQTLWLANEFDLLNSTTAYLDGTKMSANASKHHAYSFGHAQTKKALFEKEILELEQMIKDGQPNSDSDIDVQFEIELRRKKLAVVNHAIEAINQRAAERYENASEEYEKNMEARRQKELETGKKCKGKVPSPPKKEPDIKERYNLTDPDSRIMLGNQKNFIQGYNAGGLC